MERLACATHRGKEDLIELLFSCLYFHSEGLSHMTIAPLTPEPSSLPSLLHPSILLSSPSCWPRIVPEGGGGTGDTLCHPSRLRGSTFCQPGSRLSPWGVQGATGSWRRRDTGWKTQEGIGREVSMSPLSVHARKVHELKQKCGFQVCGAADLPPAGGRWPSLW